jgi:hypothetical protein
MELEERVIDRSAIEFEGADGSKGALSMPDEKLLVEKLIKRQAG